MPSFSPPGTRKGNKKWIVRGRVDGAPYEITTDARTKKEAQREWELFAADIRASDCKNSDAAAAGEWNFKDALIHYKTSGDRSPEQIGFIERLISRHIDIAATSMPLKKAPLSQIRPGAVRKLVIKAYAKAANSTRNRQGVGPIRAVINCAAEDDHCPAIKIKPFPETRRAKRRPDTATENLLLKNTEGIQHLYLAVIFRHGFRVTETLGITWETGIDLQRRMFILYVGKARTEKPIPMHDDVFELLASTPAADRHGRLFHWANRSSVDAWLTHLTGRLGVKFTSHMARHEWASVSNEHGFTAPDMVAAGSWTDARSLKDYTDVDFEHARDVIQRKRK